MASRLRRLILLAGLSLAVFALSPTPAPCADPLISLNQYHSPDSACAVVFTVVKIEVPDLDELDFYQSANSMLKKVYETELTLLTINVSRVIGGDCAVGEQRVYTLAITPNRGADIAGHPRQVLFEGCEAVGILPQGSTAFGGRPCLSGGPYFVFGVPGSEGYLRESVEPVLSLYEEHFQR